MGLRPCEPCYAVRPRLHPTQRCTHLPYTTLFRSTPRGRSKVTKTTSMVRPLLARTQTRTPSPAALAPSVKRMLRTNGSDRKSTRLNSSHLVISYAVFCSKKKKSHDVQLSNIYAQL